MFTPDLTPVPGSLALSSLVAALPLLTIFLTLAVLRWKAHWAGLAALAVAVVVAVAVYGMPPGLAFLSAAEGAAFGLFPIMWIVFTAVWLYQVTVVSGRFNDLRGAFHLISDDPRIQAIIIAFCFGGLLEALAGFGAPVAITGVMLVALGFSALRAAAVVLLANTAPVAFGAIATPIITAGTLTGIPYTEIGAYVGRQTPLLAAIVPLLLVLLVDGRRGIRETWLVAVIVGVAFGIAQFVTANYISVELTDIVAALAGLAAAVATLKVWRPAGGDRALERLSSEQDREADDPAPTGGGATTTAVAVEATTLSEHAAGLTRARVMMALLPYLLVIAVFSVAKLVPSVADFLTGTDIEIPWPGLDGAVADPAGKSVDTTVYTFEWLSSPGTLLLLSGALVAMIYRVPASAAARELGAVAYKLRYAFLTVAAVLALAYVMNLSGQTLTIGTWIAGTGAAFAYLSPILGWLGTAVTGSDTSSNALFATLQQTAAKGAGLDPTLLVAANTSGGVVGKMVSPQNLTIAATSVGLLGQEAIILRKVLLWSLGLLAVLCLLIGLQSTVLAWTLP
ncbi:MAG: L-lactate permease [Actinophytocola sp.]|nr:L-lactate permease [Actinophytocola sp.]